MWKIPHFFDFFFNPSLSLAHSHRPLSWHGADSPPVERENPFTSTALTIVPATNTANTVRLRKYKKMEYSNYNCQSKENRNLSKPAETRRRRPSSYIGTSHSPRPYTRKTEQMLTSPSLLGQNTSLSFNIQINLIEFGLPTHASFWSIILLFAFIST